MAVNNFNSKSSYDDKLKKDAEASYEKWKKETEPKYSASYKNEINKVTSQLANRNFSYDADNDEAYQKYRDSVQSSAQLALEDAMGEAASLNGGYATSYAQLAGQAAYTNTMKSADEKVLDFYKEAYDRFSDETDNIEDRLDYLLEMDDTEWDRYIDMLDDYNEEGERLYDRLRDMSDEEFDRFYSMYKLSVK